MLVSISLSSHSAETETEITIVTEVFEPFQFLDDQSKATGYGVDVVNALLTRVDLTPKFEFYP
jgi:ABC-type amino acid transport substrate-binding protein